MSYVELRQEAAEPPRLRLRRFGRLALAAFGGINVAVGVIGMFVPLMPTTVFLLIALWAFGRSSPRACRWLYGHPRLGPGLRAWRRHRAIPLPAKCAAGAGMVAGVVVTAASAEGWMLPAAVGALLVPVAGYIVTRPHAPPGDADANGPSL